MTIKTKGDALYEIAKLREKGKLPTRDDVNEAWLRWYIYGDLDERTPCTIYDTFMHGNTYKDTFPSAFAKQLIEHLIKCKDCGELYFKNNS